MDASRRPPVDPELLLPPINKTAEQIEKERIQFREELKASREGKRTALESFVRAAQNVLTISQLTDRVRHR